MIFNSLGSNYNFEFVVKALLGSGGEKDRLKLKTYLGKKYGGQVELFYKGREALMVALNLINLPKGSKVGITGFTCYAVYKAVSDSGYKVEFLDIGDGLNYKLGEVMLKKDLKVLIIQNTLGTPCRIEKIYEFCKKRDILIIEDLAHSVGTFYKNGQEAGSFGDFVTLSFSQDKIIDSISGGALVVRNKKYVLPTKITKKVGIFIQIRDRFYPLFSYTIRKTYFSGVGKILHLVLKKLNLLSRSIENKKILPHSLPGWYSKLALGEFQILEENLIKRRKISNIYKRKLSTHILIPEFYNQINLSTNLRFPVLVKDREKLIRYLKSFGIFVSDVWYNAPVAPKRFLKNTTYQGNCPKADEISEKILNLPTHKNVSEKEAEFLTEKINQWIKLQ